MAGEVTVSDLSRRLVHVSLSDLLLQAVTASAAGGNGAGCGSGGRWGFSGGGGGGNRVVPELDM